MPPIEPNPLWTKFFETTLEYKKLAPWEWLYDTNIFGIQNPETKENNYSCIMGNAGQVFGLFIYKGEKGLNSYLELSMGLYPPHSPENQHIQDGWLLAFDNREDLTKEERDLLKVNNIKCRGKNAWPNIRRYEPGLEPWLPEEQDLPFLTEVIEQTIEVATKVKSKEIALPEFDSEDILLRVKGKEGWTDEVIEHEPYEASYKSPTLDEITAHRFKNSLEQGDNIFEIDIFYAPAPIKKNAKTRGVYPKIFTLVDQQSEMILHFEMQETVDEDPTLLFFGSVLKGIEKAGFLPREIQVSKPDVECLIYGLCEALGIKLVDTGFMEVTENVKAGLFQQMMGMPFDG